MAASIERMVSEIGIKDLMECHREHPSTYIFRLFRKTMQEREETFNERYRGYIKTFRAENFPSKDANTKTLFAYGEKERAFLYDLLRRELAGSNSYNEPVPFSLTKENIFYPNVETIDFVVRWIEMVLLKEENKAEWRKILTSFYRSEMANATINSPLLCDRLALFQSYFMKDSCESRIAALFIKVLQENCGEVIDEFLQNPDASCETLTFEEREALLERLFFELYALFSEDITNSEAVKSDVSLPELLKMKILQLQIAAIKQQFMTAITQTQTNPQTLLITLLAKAKQSHLIESCNLQREIDRIGQDIIDAIDQHPDRIAEHIAYNCPRDIQPLSKEAVEKLRKKQRLIHLFLSLAGTKESSTPRKRQLSEGKTNKMSPRKRFSSLTSPRQKRKESIEDKFKNLSLRDSCEKLRELIHLINMSLSLHQWTCDQSISY